jgi:hypothetical protein
MKEVSSALLPGLPNGTPKLRIHIGFLSSSFVLMRTLSGVDRVLLDVVVGVQDLPAISTAGARRT